jgi:hypothetical protein
MAPTPRQVMTHYRRIAEAVSIPIVLYHNIPLTAVDLRTEHLVRLFEEGAIGGVKMSNPEPDRICELLQATGGRLFVYAGIDTVAFEGLCHGAHGWISGIPSIVPGFARRVYEALAERSDLPAARELWARLAPLMRLQFSAYHSRGEGAFLVAHNLLMPTVQMLLRASRKPVRAPEDYLLGKAHPVVFDSGSLDVTRMVAMARALKPDQVPPLVRLRVEEEDDTLPGVDYFEAGPAEKLFDTVSAIARIARASRRERRMVVSAEQTRDPNGRPLTFHWRLLAGDPALVRIRILDEAGARAELRIAWHERGVRAGGTLPSSRVDIGVFATNGSHTSAPAFISWYFPANEKRTYGDDGRLLAVEFLPPSVPGSYVDPALVTPADWRDDYEYTPDGRLLGWQRKRGERVEAFTRDGARILERDGQGRPLLAQAVDYRREQASQTDWPRLIQAAGQEIFRYTYESTEDPIGTRQKAPVLPGNGSMKGSQP